MRSNMRPSVNFIGSVKTAFTSKNIPKKLQIKSCPINKATLLDLFYKVKKYKSLHCTERRSVIFF